jgi:hypothetical protein
MHDRVLLLSWAVPPEPSGSAVIVGNLARQFTRNEMVVAGERPYGRAPVAWQADWPEIVYLIKGWPPTTRGARWWRRIQFPLLLVRCLRVARNHGCTAVVAVFPKEEFLLAGYLTSAWTRAKLFPYFHNTYVENRTGLSLRFARWLQSRVFRKATHVFVMSEGMVELYRARYPSLQCSALVHSFNEEIPNFAPPCELGSPLRLVICGTINESCREATLRICQAVEQIRDASLTVVSGTAGGHLKEMGVLRNGVRHETVATDKVLLRLREADIMVLAHGFKGSLAPEEYRTIFPTRTLDYLISGRPILAHTPPGCYLTRFLREHGCALIVDQPSIPSLLEAIGQLRTDKRCRAELVSNALRTAELFRASRVAEALGARLQPAQ